MTDDQEPAISEYRLRIDVDFAGLRWDGSVEFDLRDPTPRCELDAEGLRIARVRVGTAPVPFTHDAARNRLAFDVPAGARGPEGRAAPAGAEAARRARGAPTAASAGAPRPGPTGATAA